MTGSFGLYSLYYDLLYADKDYASEARYVRSLIDLGSECRVASILELGCGTGKHASLLAQDGVEVLGVDMSAEMLEGARRRVAAEGDGKARLSFALGDARTFRADRRFDVVASLFHVLSYQTRGADLDAMMQTASVHLDPGGLFVFDFWYGPAVLWQRPATRAKRLSNDHIEVTRVAEPVVHDQFNVVDVNYSVFVHERATGRTQEIKETHSMRYLFLPEIDALLHSNGLQRIAAEEWLTRRAPSVETWGVCVVARKG